MANRMTNAQYQAVKNEEYAIVKFQDGVRKSTVMGASFFRAFEEITCNVRGEMVVLVINVKDIKGSTSAFGHSRDIKDYEEYFKMKKRIY